MSTFELFKGYTPGIVGLPQLEVSAEPLKAHYEQSARRAIAKIEKSRKSQTVKPEELKKRT